VRRKQTKCTKSGKVCLLWCLAQDSHAPSLLFRVRPLLSFFPSSLLSLSHVFAITFLLLLDHDGLICLVESLLVLDPTLSPLFPSPTLPQLQVFEVTTRMVRRVIPGLYSFLKLLCRTLFHIFFRDYNAFHTATIPSNEPILVVANHGNYLLDALALLATYPGQISFLMAKPIFDTAIGGIATMIGTIPVER